MNLPPLNEQSIKNEAWRNGKERRRLGGRNVEERPGDGWMDGLVCGPLFQETFTRGRSEYNQLRPSYIPDGIVLFIIDRTKP